MRDEIVSIGLNRDNESLSGLRHSVIPRKIINSFVTVQNLQSDFWPELTGGLRKPNLKPCIEFRLL